MNKAVGDETDAWMTRDMPTALNVDDNDRSDDTMATTTDAGLDLDTSEDVSSVALSKSPADSIEREKSESKTSVDASASPDNAKQPFRLELDQTRWQERLTQLSDRIRDGGATVEQLRVAVANARDVLPVDVAKKLAAEISAVAPSSRASVGWLLRQDATKAARDGTARFQEILEEIKDGVISAGEKAEKHSTSESTSEDIAEIPSGASTEFPSISSESAPVFLFIRGLYGGHYPCYMWDIIDHFRSRGAACEISSGADGEGTTESNAQALRGEILELRKKYPGRKVVLLGHSKGGVDACACVALYEDQLKVHVTGVVTIQTPYGGSPIASDLVATESLTKVTGKALEILLRAEVGSAERLLRPLKDVTYMERLRFLEHHPLPSWVPVVSMHTATNAPSSVLSLSAQYIRTRYDDSPNDGLVARCDAEVPGCVAVRWNTEQDHADGAYPRSLSDARYDLYRNSVVGLEIERDLIGDESPAVPANTSTVSADTTSSASVLESTADDRNETATSEPNERNQDYAPPDDGSNAMVPLAEAKARAVRTRDAQREYDNEKRLVGLDFDLIGFMKDLENLTSGDLSLGNSALGGGSVDGAEDDTVDATEVSVNTDTETSLAKKTSASPPPPGAGTMLVRAYLALNKAVPERLGDSATQGEYHEALALLLMERANEVEKEQCDPF